MIIVSILSDQPVPNLRLIKHFGGNGVTHIFLSTTKVEEAGISENLRLAANIDPDQLTKRVIDPANPALISEQLASFQFDRTQTYLVNVTGGTKMMSQLVTNYFTKGFVSVRIVYLDINSGQLSEIYPEPGVSDLGIHSELTLVDYFTVHGYNYKFPEGLQKRIDFTADLMKSVISNGGPKNTPVLHETHTQYDDLSERNYFSGIWFEEWVWSQVRLILDLDEKNLQHGVKLYSRRSNKIGSDHEIDVAFIYRSKMYLLECKVFMKYDGKKLNEALFKIASISRNLGSACVPVLALCVEIPATARRHVDIISKLTRISGIISWKQISVDNFSKSLKKIIDHVS